MTKTCEALLVALEELLETGDYDNEGNYVIRDTGEYLETDSPDEALIPALARAVVAVRAARQAEG